MLTGAGLSTASGIGDYRGEDGAWKRRPPVELRDFLRSDHARRRYWSRSLFGWPHFAAARAERADIARSRACIGQGGSIGTVTQNVDGLHARAGHDGVIELHGRLADVDCLQCGQRFSRAAVQQWLMTANPSFAARIVELRADGDAELARVRSRALRGAELSDLRRSAEARRRVLRRIGSARGGRTGV